MFHNCSSLHYLNIPNIKTAGVVDMEMAFCNCTSLNSLDISHFNTSNCTNMKNMFCYCALEALVINNFETCKVTGFNV
jgi:surface protein